MAPIGHPLFERAEARVLVLGELAFQLGLQRLVQLLRGPRGHGLAHELTLHVLAEPEGSRSVAAGRVDGELERLLTLRPLRRLRLLLRPLLRLHGLGRHARVVHRALALLPVDVQHATDERRPGRLGLLLPAGLVLALLPPPLAIRVRRLGGHLQLISVPGHRFVPLGQLLLVRLAPGVERGDDQLALPLDLHLDRLLLLGRLVGDQTRELGHLALSLAAAFERAPDVHAVHPLGVVHGVRGVLELEVVGVKRGRRPPMISDRLDVDVADDVRRCDVGVGGVRRDPVHVQPGVAIIAGRCAGHHLAT